MKVCNICHNHHSEIQCPHCCMVSKPNGGSIALSVLLGVGLVACESPQALYGVPEYAQDLDGEGFDSFEDCNDEDPYTFPGAAVEDSETACMTDFDGDGYGDNNPSFGEAGTDCDDTDPTVNPGNGSCE